MTGTPPSDLGAASRLLRSAAQAYLDGPGTFLGEAADRAVQPTYDADTAAQDAVGYWVRLAQAWFGASNAMVDALAVATTPPVDSHRFVVTVPAAPVVRTATISATQWTWLLPPEPVGAIVTLRPPLTLAAQATAIGLTAAPLVLEPSWDVTLRLAPTDGSPATHEIVSLDLLTELAPGTPWPMDP